MASIDDRRWTTRGGERVPTSYTGDKPWRARWRDPDGAQRAQNFAKIDDARKYLVSIESRMQLGEYVDPRAGRTTFGDVAEEWLGTVAHLKPTTLAGYRSVLGLVPELPARTVGGRVLEAQPERIRAGSPLGEWGKRPVNTIDPTTIRRYTSRMFADGRNFTTVKNTLGVVRAVMATAVESRMLASNPAAGIRLDKAKARSARVKRQQSRVFLTAKEVERLANEMPGDYPLLVRFAAYSGLRAGELAGLQVHDLDMLRRRVRVRRAVEEVRGHLHVGTPKSGDERTVTLPAFLVDEVGAYLASTGLQGQEWLFRSPTGGTLRHSGFYARQFKPAAIRAEMPDGLRFHDLRHTCAALLIAQGAHPKAVSERLGHQSIEITMDTYGHLYESVEDALADALDTVRAAALEDSVRTERGLGQI